MKYHDLMAKIDPTTLFEWSKNNPSEWDNIFIEMVKDSHQLNFNPTIVVRLPDYTLTSNPNCDEISRLDELAISVCEKKYCVFSEICVLFEDEDDAIMFKLKWVSNEN